MVIKRCFVLAIASEFNVNLFSTDREDNIKRFRNPVKEFEHNVPKFELLYNFE